MSRHLIGLTDKELSALRACVSGELDNDDGHSGHYMEPLRRVARKLDAAHAAKSNRSKGA